MIYLTTEELLDIADIAIGGKAHVRDPGMLASAAARPQASVFGEDAYPTLLGKAAALMHSLINNHAMFDGNKRLGLLATVTFCALNGVAVAMPADVAHDLAVGVAVGTYDLEQIAEQLERFSGSATGRNA